MGVRPSKSTAWRWKLLLLVWVVASGLAVSPSKITTGQAIKPAALAANLAPAEAPPEIKGRLVPLHSVELGVSMMGRVETVMAREGDRVKAGQVLLRLDSYEDLAARLPAAELALIQAHNARKNLDRSAGVSLAEATRRLRQAEKDQALAEDLLTGLYRAKNPARIEQAYANLLLAEKRLNDLRDDLRIARQKYANKKNIIWMFINQRKFRLMINGLEKGIAYAERRYWDAREKYEDLLKPVDAVDLNVAEARLVEAQARVQQAELDQAKLLEGPDPADVAAAEARIRAAQAGLEAARGALRMAEVTAPADGTLVKLDARVGEWAVPGKPLAVIADLSEWQVESENLDEKDAPAVQAGQPVSLTLDAYPDLQLGGIVKSVSLYYEEDDGDIHYHVKVQPERTDAHFRWGLTTRILFTAP